MSCLDISHFMVPANHLNKQTSKQANPCIKFSHWHWLLRLLTVFPGESTYCHLLLWWSLFYHKYWINSCCRRAFFSPSLGLFGESHCGKINIPCSWVYRSLQLRPKCSPSGFQASSVLAVSQKLGLQPEHSMWFLQVVKRAWEQRKKNNCKVGIIKIVSSNWPLHITSCCTVTMGRKILFRVLLLLSYS